MHSIDIQENRLKKTNNNAMFYLCCTYQKNKRSTYYKSSVYLNILLTHLDSNQERQNQNLQCYHYTMGQYLRHKCNQKNFFDEEVATKFFK